MKTGRRLIALVLAIALLGAMAGCKKKSDEAELTPKVAPPVIGTVGVLRAGVDLGYPPFAGTDKGIDAGIDIDVAAAIAEKLGLKLQVVDVAPADMTQALNDNKVDIMLGATPITGAVLADVSSAGSYLTDGPAFFVKVAEGSEVTTLTVADLPGKRVAAQAESAAFWKLESDFGQTFAGSYPTLRAALEALNAGEVDIVVGDAAVGAYIARDYPGIAFAGQYGPAQLLGVAVKKDATDLEGQVRSVLDGLAADGTLDAIRSQWLGGLPKLEMPASAPVS